jgi:uncharacterized membrane protein YfcA
MDVFAGALLITIGFLVGTVGTLIGAGGGFMLVPVLLLMYPTLPPEVITSISLAVIFLNAVSGSIAYAKMKRIDYRSAWSFALATLPGAVAGAFITSYLPRRLFDIVLGILLLAIALFLLFKPKKIATAQNKKPFFAPVHRDITDNAGHRYTYSFNQWIGNLLSVVVGFVSSLLGIGGGIIHVPALTGLLNFPIQIATATSHYILAIMALAGTLVHIFQGTLQQSWLMVVLIGTGVIAGAQLGAYFSHRMRPQWIVRALAIALLIVGIRILFTR